MASTASASSSVRYAPEDPTLPKPWKGLIDGSTGYLYFWNPETNVTQYERPAANQPQNLPPPPPNPPKTALIATGSSFQGKHSSAPAGHGQQRDIKEDDGRYSGSRSNQSMKSTTHSQSYANGSVNVGHGTSNAYSHGHGAHGSKSSARGHGSSDAGTNLTAESYRRQHEISVTGDDVPSPFMTFESTGFPSEILKEVHHAGFSFPTPIQAQSWPIALQSRDIVAIAKTGSGKTLGYLIPGFIHLKRLRNNSRVGPTVLVVAPTRELATQIQEEAVKFGRSSRISCTCLYGGAPKGPQLRDLDRGADVVVATPGRLNDILEMRKISLRQVSYLVLDEADRMLDMGFEPQIRKIVKEVPPRRQTLMFTATWPKEVRKIAADLLVHPVQVNIGSIDELVANSAITQHVEVMTPMEKQRRLEHILRSQEPGSKVIVFCSTKRMCDQLARGLTRSFGAAAIHGDKSQSERDYVLSQFRTGRSPILVATDVAARGLDIKDIRVVINYDFPTGVEDYVHRIGRTGRAGATGVSYTFFCDQDAKYASDLIKVLEGANQRVPSELRGMVSRGGYGKARSRWGSSSGGRDGGRSLGGGRNDSGYGGRGGWGSSGGRSESARGGREQSDREPPRDRYDRGYYGSHQDDDERARHDKKGIMGNDSCRPGDQVGNHSRSRSRSRSPVGVQSVWNDNRSPNKGHGEGGGSRSRSHSRSRNHGNGGRSRSRSRSRSLNRYGEVESGRGWSPAAAKQRSPPNQRTGPGHSPPRHHQQPHRSPYNGDREQPKRSPSPYNGDGMHPQRSPSPYNGDGVQPQRSPSPYNDGMQPQRSPSPYDGHENQPWRSPAQHDGGDGMREAAPAEHTPNLERDKSRLPDRSLDDETHASATPTQQWRTLSPQYGGDANAEGPGDAAPVRSSAPPYQGGEEEEEGAIPADEDSMIPIEAGGDSPRD